MTANPNHQAILAAIVRGEYREDLPFRLLINRALHPDLPWGRDSDKPRKASIVDADKELERWRKPPPEEPYIESDFSFDCDECILTTTRRRAKADEYEDYYHYGGRKAKDIPIEEKVQEFLDKNISHRVGLKQEWDQSLKAPEAVVKAYEVAASKVWHSKDSGIIMVGLKLMREVFRWTSKSTALEKEGLRGSELSLQILWYFNWLMEHESQVTSTAARHRGQYLLPMIIALIKGYMLKLRAAYHRPQNCRSRCTAYRERMFAAALKRGKSLCDILSLAKARWELGTLNPVGEVVLPAQQPPVTLMCEALTEHLKTQLRQVLKTIRERTMFDDRVPDVATLMAVLPFLRGVTAIEPQTVGRKRTHDGEPKDTVDSAQSGQGIANVQLQELASALSDETDISKLKTLDGVSVRTFIDENRSRARRTINLTLRTSFDSIQVIVSLLHIMLVSLCRNEHWPEAASVADHLIFTLREAIEASTLASESSSPSPVLSKSLALVLGTKAVALRKSARASQGAVAAKEGASILRTIYNDGNFGRDILTLALLNVEATCCYINSSASSAITNAISAAEEAVKVCRQAVGDGNLAVQAKPILARALILQARVLAKGKRGGDAQAIADEGVAMYRELVVKDPGLYEVQLAEAICRRADMYRDQEPLKQIRPLMEATQLYDGQCLRWASLSTDDRFDQDQATYKQEKLNITFGLQTSAVDCAEKASTLAFSKNDFDGALRFAKASEALNLLNVVSSKDVTRRQVYHLADALCTSGYSNFMMKRPQAAVVDLLSAVNIYQHCPLRLWGDRRYESLDVRANACLGAAYCSIGDQERAMMYVSKAVRDIEGQPRAFYRPNASAANRARGERGLTDHCQFLVFQAGIQIRGGRFEEAEVSLTEALGNHVYDGRPILKGDYEKTALILKARVLQAGGRVEEGKETLKEANIVEGRDLGYLFTASDEP
ncbi:hypothetical protein A4X13_0g2968 [Tilletia indica]|uniref:Uncharacterized protein n=1 Tax=Tilletia indica TaxID=43049 RepID=A0A177TB37_9BASI|nr:hypothetical protein A4X13_0g2968 [Tilletia indica]